LTRATALPSAIYGFRSISRETGVDTSTLSASSNTVGIANSLVAEGGETKFKDTATAGNMTELNRQMLRNLAQDFKCHSPIAKRIGTTLKPMKAIAETTCKLVELLLTKGASPASKR